MNQKDRIRTLEEELAEEETYIKALFQMGKVLTPGDYAEVDRLKNELKAARRVKAMDAKRIDPKLTRKISLLLPEDEYQALKKNAYNAGVDLSKYIRQLLIGKSGG